MSHEKSITFGVDGKFYNVGTVRNGKQLTPKAAIDMAIKTDSLGKGYKSKEEAVGAAVKRSRGFDRPKNPSSKLRVSKR